MREFKITERLTLRSRGIDRYLNEVSKFAILTPDEELILAKRISKGDDNAVHELVTANLRFVISVAKQYNGGNITKFEDLINEGNTGLIDAARTFDHSTGFRFISYAIWHIRKYMMLYLTQHSRQIRLPQNKITSISKMRQLEAEMTSKIGRDLTEDEIVDIYLYEKYGEPSKNEKLEHNKREALISAFRADVRSAPLEGSGTEDADFVPINLINGDPNGADHLIKDEEYTLLINHYLDKLSSYDRSIIKRVNGIGTDLPESYTTIANESGLSPEAIRKRYKKSIRKLKSMMAMDRIRLNSFS
jgi:RNA polymerase primary sigma factor